MNGLLATICLTIAVLLGSVGVSESTDLRKGYTAYKSGDYATVLREFQPLAEQGDASAQSFLAASYALGNGVLKDYVYAHMWGNIAASNGNEKGVKLRDSVAEQMTPTQLEKAQDLARECVRKKYKDC